MKDIKSYLSGNSVVESKLSGMVDRFWCQAWDEDLESLSTSKDICRFIEDLDNYSRAVSKDVDKRLVGLFKEMFKEK